MENNTIVKGHSIFYVKWTKYELLAGVSRQVK